MRIAAWAGAALATPFLASGPALADTMPLPQVDYAAVVKTPNLPDPVTVRHHDGVFRVEFDTGGRKQALLIDPKKPQATVLEKVDGKMTATETPSGAFNLPYPGIDSGAGKVGSDHVAGEACDLWRRQMPELHITVDACVSADGILLRITRPDYDAPWWVTTKLERAPQDPALFVVPADATKLAPSDTP